MKRSEVLKNMVQIIASRTGHYSDAEEGAPEVLQYLESIGMLPPCRNADQRSDYGYARVWIWENEE